MAAQVIREVGSKVSVSLPVEKYDETVLVGLKAQDEEGRRGNLSNIVSIYVESLPTTTVPTIPTSSSPTSPTTTALPRTYTAKTFWLVVGSLLLFLLLLLCLVATWCMCRRRGEGGEDWKEGGNGWREDMRREGGRGGEVVQVGERRAATKQEWDLRRGARSGWEVSGRGLEVEERIEERRAPPRYENPPDILPNPNSDGLGRAVRFQPIKVSRESSSVSNQHQGNWHRSMMKTNGSLGHGHEESSDEDTTTNRGSSPSSSILAFKVEEPQPRSTLDPLYYISNDLELRRGEADLSRSNSSLAQRQREAALKLHRRRLQNAQVLDGKGRKGQAPSAPKPRVQHAPPPPSSSSSSTSPSLSSEEGEQVDMEEQDYIRHVTNTNMKGPGVENRPFNYIAFR